MGEGYSCRKRCRASLGCKFLHPVDLQILAAVPRGLLCARVLESGEKRLWWGSEQSSLGRRHWLSAHPAGLWAAPGPVPLSHASHHSALGCSSGLVVSPAPCSLPRTFRSFQVGELFFGLRVTTQEAKPMVGAPRGIQRSAHFPLWQVGWSWTWHEDRPRGASSWSTQPLARAGDQASKPGWFKLAHTALGAELCPARSGQLGSCAGE